MTTDPNLGVSPLFFTRRKHDRQYFLCDRCGSVHGHGLSDGHRSSHCKTSEFRLFGHLLEDYSVMVSAQKPGRLTTDESKAAQRISYQAWRLTEAVSSFLDIADVDPTSKASILLLEAKIAINKLAAVEVGSRNPFEVVTDDDWQNRDQVG